MSIQDRAKAAAQNVEGKGQEVVGKATGSSQDEAAGKAKQAGAKVSEGIEDTKDKVADVVNKADDKIRDGIGNTKNELNK